MGTNTTVSWEVGFLSEIIIKKSEKISYSSAKSLIFWLTFHVNLYLIIYVYSQKSDGEKNRRKKKKKKIRIEYVAHMFFVDIEGVKE